MTLIPESLGEFRVIIHLSIRKTGSSRNSGSSEPILRDTAD